MMKRLLLGIFGAMVAASLVYAAEVSDYNTTDASNIARFPENMAPSAVNDGARANEGITARWYQDWNSSVIAYGTGNAISATPNRTISAYFDGLTFAFEATAANTDAVTFRLGALTATTLTKAHDLPLVSGDIEAGQKIIVIYNADEDAFQMITPVANDTAGDMLASTYDAAGITQQLVGTAATQTLTHKTIDADAAGQVITNIGSSEVKSELITGQTNATAATDDRIIFSDTSDSGNLKDGTIQDVVDLAAGTIVQVVSVQDGTVATGTTTLPNDNTIPQNTEGDEYMTLAITPTSATNKLLIEVTWFGASGAAGTLTTALFQDTTANALAAVGDSKAATNEVLTNTFSHYMTSGTTSTITFKVRAGSNNAGTITFNGSSATIDYGGVAASSIRIWEISI